MMIELEIDLGLFPLKYSSKTFLAEKPHFQIAGRFYYIPMPFNIFEVLTRGLASKRLM